MAQPGFKATTLCFFTALLAGCGGGSSGGSAEPDPIALSGAINIEANTRVDGDTADKLVFGSKLLSEPQTLPAAVVLAGYVSGSSGNYPADNGLSSTSYEKDPVDEFEIALKPEQSLLLQTFISRAGESAVIFSIREPGSPNTILDQSRTGPDVRELRVTLPADKEAGDYLVSIEIDDLPPMPYVFSSLEGSTAGVQSFDWPRHEFVPGEAVVSMSGAGTDMAAALSASGGRIGWSLGNNTWHAQAPASVRAQSRQGDATLQWVRALRNAPGVAKAIPNYKVRSQNSPTGEPLFPRQWHYSLISAPTAWQLAPEGGQGATVAVLDTGLFRQGDGKWHRDLDANVVDPIPEGADFVSPDFDIDAEPGRDNDPADPGNTSGSSVYHGTHVAGTVSAVVNGQGGTGMAFGSRLLPVRVLGDGGAGSAADLLDAIRWVSGFSDDGERKADIVNLSLGGLPFIESMQNVITEATTQSDGVIFVAAAGNQNTSTKSYPAAFENVFAVSAVDGAGELSSYSNFGDWIDLAAPGGDARRDANGDGRADLVISTSASVVDGVLEPNYAGLQGTSMASPHVAGVFALMKGVNGATDYGQLLAWLLAGELTVSDSSGTRNDSLGYGLIDAAKAVLAASDSASTILAPSPTRVSLSSETNPSEVVTLKTFGAGDEVTLESEPASPSWLDVTVDPGAGSTAATFDLKVSLNTNDDALKDGAPLKGQIEIAYRGDQSRTLEIPVTAQLVTDQQARDAGGHFVLLVPLEPNPDTGVFETVSQVEVPRPENGQYQFSFRHDDGEAPRTPDEVVPGQYFLVAGTDLDNDGFICQAGEACAEYPVAGLREAVEITADGRISGIELTTSYNRPTISASSPGVLPRPDFDGYRLLRGSSDAGQADTMRRTR